jgi:hypothetical protein
VISRNVAKFLRGLVAVRERSDEVHEVVTFGRIYTVSRHADDSDSLSASYESDSQAKARLRHP